MSILIRYEERLFDFGVLASQGYAETSCWCRRPSAEGGENRTVEQVSRRKVQQQIQTRPNCRQQRRRWMIDKGQWIFWI